MNKTFGEVLKNQRKIKGLSQEKLAFKADVHRTYVSMLERDEKSCTLEVLFRLCAALDIQPSQLLKEMEQGN